MILYGARPTADLYTSLLIGGSHRHLLCFLFIEYYTWKRLPGKESACNAGDASSIPGSGRSLGKGNGNPLQYSCLENAKDGGVCRVTVDLATKPPPNTWKHCSYSQKLRLSWWISRCPESKCTWPFKGEAAKRKRKRKISCIDFSHWAEWPGGLHQGGSSGEIGFAAEQQELAASQSWKISQKSSGIIFSFTEDRKSRNRKGFSQPMRDTA